MCTLPEPDEVERGEPVSLDVVLTLLREWRNHWVSVERVYDDLPDAIQQIVRTRPTVMSEALAELVTQHAVRVHPDAASTFVAYLNAVIRAVERCQMDIDLDKAVSAGARRSGQQPDVVSMSPRARDA